MPPPIGTVISLLSTWTCECCVGVIWYDLVWWVDRHGSSTLVRSPISLWWWWMMDGMRDDVYESMVCQFMTIRRSTEAVMQHQYHHHHHHYRRYLPYQDTSACLRSWQSTPSVTRHCIIAIEYRWMWKDLNVAWRRLDGGWRAGNYCRLAVVQIST